MTNNTLVTVLPWLYYKDSHGEMRRWRVAYVGDCYWTEYGRLDGVLTLSESTTCYPTNEGRSNVRSSEEQVAFEANSLWENKLQRRYRKTVEEAAKELFLPMLANKYKGREEKVDYPCYVQPKLDGVRCLAYWTGEDVALMSRQGKPYDVPHISNALKSWLPRDVVLDGELYMHGASCQSITSLVRGDHGEAKAPLEYWVYDIAGSMDFRSRYAQLWQLCQMVVKPKCVKQVETLPANDSIEIRRYHDFYVTTGFEGAIVRTKEGFYKFGRRSNDLLKVKEFQDAEFIVVDWKDGQGKLSDCCIFQCRNDINNQTFWCIPKGTINQREDYASNARGYVGRKLTVRFFDRTEDGLPRFPVGVCFRDEKDLPHDEATKD